MITIEEITFDKIEPYKKQASKEMLCFAMNTKYYGLFVDGELRAFTGLLWQNQKVIFKNHYVLPKYRGYGYFKKMFQFSLSMTGGYKIEATCSPMSIRYYLTSGFLPGKHFKNGCVKVTYENY